MNTTEMSVANAMLDRVRRLLPSNPDLGLFADIVLAGTDEQAMAGLSEQDLARLVEEAFGFHAQRGAGEHNIRVRSQTFNGDARRSVVEIVNDDMPFLVDSVLGELRSTGHGADIVLHPIMKVRRDSGGKREAIVGRGDGNWNDGQQESLIVLVIDHVSESQAADLQQHFDHTLTQVRASVTDWKAMLIQFEDAVHALERNPPAIDGSLLSESVSFCRWLIGNQFTFLGVRRYVLDGDQETGQLVPVEGSGLGVLRDPSVYVLSKARKPLMLTPEIRRFVFTPEPLIITKSNLFSRVHRRAYMDYIGLKTYSVDGRQTGELRLVGLFTSQAYTERPANIPFLRQKVDHVMQRAGFAAGSHSGKALMSVLENFPRDELFRVSEERLVEWSRGILDLDLRPRVRVFTRRDRFDRFVSALVYVPRESFSTGARERIGEVLSKAVNGRVSAFNPFFPEGPLIRVHYIIGRNHDGPRLDIDEPALEAEITELTRNWNDQLALAMSEGGAAFEGLKPKYLAAFSPGYAENFNVARALQDIQRIERLGPERPAAIDFRVDHEVGPKQIAAAVYRFDEPIPLSERVPVLENFGFRSIDERSYRVRPQFADGQRRVTVHDMLLEIEDGAAVDLEDEGVKLEDGFLAVRNDHADNDPFNRLIHAAKLHWREVALLRSYAAYLRQIGSPFGMRYVADTLLNYPQLTRDLVAMFQARFDPDVEQSLDQRQALQQDIAKRVEEALVDVPSLDEDRILRHYLNLIRATKRTNFFRAADAGGYPPTISFKFAPREIDGVPEPRPYREIWVYSPRVEGVHLRFGPIARGGLRWSDRAQDFRTEVLGLCKAQQVKNTVIVPDGSKGGFLPKRLPRGGSREAFMAEGVAAYQIFITSLIEITDNIVDGQIVPPERVVRHDGDDPYLVVAADKGTATFSDYANEISQSRGFWLGDAFASGGSAGYDHKKMGITARGGWESVKRHFREMDVDIQTMPFTAAGVGDMSGDVFGNGMLLSPATKLVAAFDHRDIFIDPDPDPETSFAERQRLFDIGRSSWQDYDTTKISEGGGVFPRTAKSIAISDQMRELLGISAQSMTPNELLQSILKAEVDLLWFGGIGTYIRAEGETDDEAGDRANDPIRVTGREVRAKVIGEGANLGATQRGRIEFAQSGGRINTDFIDNSAGVNSSDKEVNIKIAVGGPLRDGRLDLEARNELLASMTEEIAEACLWNNYQQSLAISLATRRSASEIGFFGRLMRDLETRDLLNRELEVLPSDDALASRQSAGRGLTRPEISVLLSWSKIALAQDLMDSDVPDRAENEIFLLQYFPRALRRGFQGDLINHQLRREIIVTRISNAMINRAGPTMAVRLKDETGRNMSDIASAFIATMSIFELPKLWAEIDQFDNQITGDVQLDLYQRTQDLLLEQTADLLRREHGSDFASAIAEYQGGVAALADVLDEVATAKQQERIWRNAWSFEEGKVSNELAARIAKLDLLRMAPSITRIAKETGTGITDAARIALDAFEFFRVGELMARTDSMQLTDYYDQLALSTAMGTLESASQALTRAYLGAPRSNGVDLASWVAENSASLQQAKSQIDGIVGGGEITVSRLTVAATQVREMIGH